MEGTESESEKQLYYPQGEIRVVQSSNNVKRQDTDKRHIIKHDAFLKKHSTKKRSHKHC